MKNVFIAFISLLSACCCPTSKIATTKEPNTETVSGVSRKQRISRIRKTEAKTQRSISEADMIPREIENALERLPQMPVGTQDIISYLGLKSPKQEPYSTYVTGRAGLARERWEIGFDDRYLLEIVHYRRIDGDPSVVESIKISLLKKTGQTGSNAYMPLKPGFEGSFEPQPRQPEALKADQR